jgi:putative ABC transport system substrate-binding protein
VTNRRRFLATLTGGLLAAPLVGLAQQPAKVPRIGVISERYSGDPMVEAFRQELRDLGYVEGQNVVIEYRYLHGVLDRVPAFARELIRIPVDVLVVSGTISTKLAKAEPATIPIVFILAGDPVGSGLVASLARPGGNVTGMSNLQSELGAKQLELLKAVAPRIVRVAVVYNPVSLPAALMLDRVRKTALALGVELQLEEVRQPSELAKALSTVMVKRPDAGRLAGATTVPTRTGHQSQGSEGARSDGPRNHFCCARTR